MSFARAAEKSQLRMKSGQLNKSKKSLEVCKVVCILYSTTKRTTKDNKMKTLYSLTICTVNGLTAEKYDGIVTEMVTGLASSWWDIVEYVKNFNDENDIEIVCEEKHLQMLLDAGYGIKGFSGK